MRRVAPRILDTEANRRQSEIRELTDFFANGEGGAAHDARVVESDASRCESARCVRVGLAEVRGGRIKDAAAKTLRGGPVSPVDGDVCPVHRDPGVMGESR